MQLVGPDNTKPHVGLVAATTFRRASWNGTILSWSRYGCTVHGSSRKILAESVNGTRMVNSQVLCKVACLLPPERSFNIVNYTPHVCWCNTILQTPWLSTLTYLLPFSHCRCLQGAALIHHSNVLPRSGRYLGGPIHHGLRRFRVHMSQKPSTIMLHSGSTVAHLRQDGHPVKLLCAKRGVGQHHHLRGRHRLHAYSRTRHGRYHDYTCALEVYCRW